MLFLFCGDFFKFKVGKSQYECIAFAIDTPFEKGAVGSASIAHHQGFVAFGTATHQHQGVSFGELLGHVVEEVEGEAIDMLHLIASFEHEHAHGLILGYEFACPAQGHTFESDVGCCGAIGAHLLLCAIGQVYMLVERYTVGYLLLRGDIYFLQSFELESYTIHIHFGITGHQCLCQCIAIGLQQSGFGSGHGSL